MFLLLKNVLYSLHVSDNLTDTLNIFITGSVIYSFYSILLGMSPT